RVFGEGFQRTRQIGVELSLGSRREQDLANRRTMHRPAAALTCRYRGPPAPGDAIEMQNLVACENGQVNGAFRGVVERVQMRRRRVPDLHIMVDECAELEEPQPDLVAVRWQAGNEAPVR